MLPHRSRQRGPFIGLDIGSHAIRAAEVKVDGNGATLQHYAQVDLPPGAVADGEVVDGSAVTSALHQLWAAGKFSHQRVVVGVSSQRAIVRQADVPAMTDDELRTALKFEAQDLIPIPVEDALLDFSTIDGHLPVGDPSEPPKMRILLAAAHRDMVNGHLGALRSAGLKPIAVDPTALALLRAIPTAAPDNAAGGGTTSSVVEAVVDVGAPLTTVAVREDGIARFVRVLHVGGPDLSDDAPSGQAGSAGGRQQSPQPMLAPGPVTMTMAPRVAAGGRVRALVDDIRGSLDFYLAQADSDRIDRIVVTGEVATTDGFLPRLQEALGRTVEMADPLSTVRLGNTGLSQEALQEAVPYLVMPIGLALWGTVRGRPITLLPNEVLKATKERQKTMAVVFAVTAFAALLGVAWTSRMVQVTSAQHQATQAKARAGTLTAQVASLNDITQIDAALTASLQLHASALTKDVDWIRLVQQVTAVMPADVHLSSLTVQRAVATAAGTTAPATASDGTITFTGTAKNAESVANWLRALKTLPGLSGAWVTAITQSTGAPGQSATGVTFLSSASVTSAAESQRSIQAGAAR